MFGPVQFTLSIIYSVAGTDGLTCCPINLLISGSQCPNALTAIPAVKSKYRRFSMSHR